MSYKPANPNGQATMANSEPVVIASDQSAVPVSGTVTANLSATDNAVLDAIAASVDTIDSVDFATQTTLAAIKAKTDNIPAQGQALAAASTPVVLPAAQITTLTPLSTVAVTQSGTWDEVGINDSGNSITIDYNGSAISTSNAVPVQPPASGYLNIAIDQTGNNNAVDVLTMPTTTVQATNLDIRDLTSASDSVAVHGDVGVIDQIDLASSNPLTVAIVDGSGDQITSFGGGTQYTEGDTDTSITGTVSMMEVAANTLQPIQGTVADGLLVNLGSNNDVTITGTATVSATDLDIRNLTNTDVVTAELSAVDNAVLDNIDADLTTIIGHVDGLETSNSAIQTAVQLIDDTVQVLGTDTYTEASSKGITLGAVRRDADTTLVNTTNEFGPLQMDANGRLKVEAFSGEALPVTFTGSTDVATQTTLAAINTKLVSGTDIGDVTINNASGASAVNIQDGGNSITVDYATTGSGTSTGALRVELPTNGTGIVGLAAGTNGIGKLTANSGVTIGAVEIAAAQTLGTVTTVSTLTGGGIAHDSADSGNPIKIGFKAYSPDGTTPGTAVAENDRTDAKGDLDGRLYTNDEHPRYWSYHVNGSSALTDASVQASPGAGFQLVITDIQFSNGASTAINMFLEEGASTIWGPVYLEAVNGRGYVWKGKKHVTAATALTLTTSSATAHSVEILGYIQAV